MSIPVVEAVAVSRHYTQAGPVIEALKPASFRVMPGDRIALVGPSGSGKSTLLYLMADIESPSGGTLEWPALGNSGTLRPSRIGMVFQTPSLLPMLSVEENVELPMRLDHCSENARAKAMAALEMVGLGTLADRLPDELSGGQAQRVGIARALAHRPALILADEPTGQLDHAAAQMVFDTLLHALAGSPTALVVATHDPLVAARLDTVWTISRGVLDVAAGLGAGTVHGAHARR